MQPNDITAGFWRRVAKHPTDPEGCWIWLGLRPDRYSMRGLVVRPADVTWAAKHGPIPEGGRVERGGGCYAECVNPAHLELSAPPLTDDDIDWSN